ncbi:MAG: type II 3-dehydroquinate dehydratase [Clostridiales bacterium]|nr:type II 3-dehydroquinate dehydratase [Clostridiales bacterium]
MRILVINGPNINMLGIREKDIYGKTDYSDLVAFIEAQAAKMGIKADCFQSNHEGDLVDAIQKAFGKYDGIVINPAAYTHTSIAILDALKAVDLPAVEVHLSDISQREDFRQISYAGRACEKTYMGLGFEGYKKALEYLKEGLSK